MQHEISSSYFVPSRAFGSCLNQKLIIKFRELARKEGRLGKSYRVTVRAEGLVQSLVKSEGNLPLNLQ